MLMVTAPAAETQLADRSLGLNRLEVLGRNNDIINPNPADLAGSSIGNIEQEPEGE